jgi:hypothetical protein
MDYGFGKTFKLEDKFHALNGAIQHFEVEFKEVELDQANLLRALEVLRTYGGQPIITAVEGKVLKFTLEQANVYGDPRVKQVSEKDFVAEAEAMIKHLFENVLAVDGETSFAVASVKVDEAF